VNKSEKLLERAQKNNVLPPSKAKSSGSKTKPGTTDSLSERIGIDLFATWLDNQDLATQESFLSFSEDNYSIIECYLYARFLGYKGAIASCEAWVTDRFPKPDHRKILLDEIQEMQEDIRKLREDVENLAVKRDVGVARIAAMQKELRSTIAQVEQFTSNKDCKALLMTGADRAIRELMSIFRDDPIEGPLHEASMSVWAKIQLDD
jgi:hypothetical protein